MKTVISALTASAVLAAAQSCGGSDNPWQVQLPSSSNPVSTSFTVDISGSSSDGQYSINISGNQGTVNQAGEVIDLVVKNQIPFGGNLVLYSLLGTTDDAVVTSWAYCTGSELTSLWLESTLGNAAFTPSSVSGSCSVNNNPTTVDLDSTSECINVAQPSAVPTMNGAQLSLSSGSPGSVFLNDETYNLLPYTVVDCSNCGSTSTAGWYEVHSIMQAPSSDDVCIGIFYLYTQCSSSIPLDYVQCLQGSAGDTSFTASYDLSPVSPGSSSCS